MEAFAAVMRDEQAFLQELIDGKTDRSRELKARMSDEVWETLRARSGRPS